MKKQKSEEVDLNANKHMGQIALRKLYHESPRPIVVLYTASTCGPCRTLKPIVHGVADEFGDQARLLSPGKFPCLSGPHVAFILQPQSVGLLRPTIKL